MTDVDEASGNIKILVHTGRCRWKSENELFNVIKKHRYYMDRNYGHGQKNLAFNSNNQSIGNDKGKMAG